jgi:hypothetical protein
VALDFPNSPTVGQRYPSPAIAGTPVYQWDGTKWVTASISSPNLPAEILQRTNIVVNGGCEVCQIYPSGVVGMASATAYYISDNIFEYWINSGSAFNGATVFSGNSSPLPFNYFQNFKVTTFGGTVAAGDFAGIFLPIEGSRLSHLLWGTASGYALPATLCFWLNCTVTGQFSVGIRNASSNRSYVIPLTYSSAGTWVFYTVTIPADTLASTTNWGRDNTQAAQLFFTFLCGTTLTTSSPNTWQSANYVAASGQTNFFGTANNAVNMSGFGMWAGSVSPPNNAFLCRNFSEELILCQRYFQKSYDHATGLGAVTAAGALANYTNPLQGSVVASGSMYCKFPVQMRSVPTIQTYSPVTGAVGKIADRNVGSDVTPTVDSVGTTGFRLWASTAAASAAFNMAAHYYADARLA